MKIKILNKYRSYYHRLVFRIKILYVNYVYSFFSKTVQKQLKDFRTIPIIIINYNHLETLKLQVNYLLKNAYYNIHIIDNNSSYEPLLSYYKNIDNRVKLHRMDKNYGHMVFWYKNSLFQKFSNGYYVVTDPDVLPVEECPTDFLKYFLKTLQKLNSKYKVGFSLKIDDIPNSYPSKQKVLLWEKKYWERESSDGNYIADIDTTFALYRPLLKTNKFFYSAVRIKYPYQAKHYGWYLDPENLSEEQAFYIKSTNSSSSWNYTKGEF